MPYGHAESWTVLDGGWLVVEPAGEVLSYLHSVERSPNTGKAYAHDVRDYFEFLGPAKVMAVLDGWGRRRDRLLVTLLAEAGLRIGEALGLRHEDIDAAAGLVAVVPRVNANGARAKSGRRLVPVPARVIRLYSDY